VSNCAIQILFALSVLIAPLPAATEGEAVTSHIPREQIESSAIRAVGYSKRRHILELEFVNGTVYRYLEVAPSVYRDLMTAESKARYYDANIKRNYRSVRVRPRVKDQSNT
jgi:lysyl-tRNA synthetase class 2